MLAAELMHILKTGMLAIPFDIALTLDIILIILKQFLVATTGNPQKFQFSFRRGLSITATLNYVLFGATGRLYHLVNRSVAILF